MIKRAIFLLVLFFPMIAHGQGTRVFDQAGLFTSNEATHLVEEIHAWQQETGMDMAIVTINDAGGQSSRDFATGFYVEQQLGENGVLFLIDMDNREIYIVTHGTMIAYLTDARVENVLDEAFYYMSDGDFYGAALAFIDEVGWYIDAGIAYDQYIFDEETGRIIRQRSLEGWEIGMAIVGAFAAGGAFYGVVAMRYRGRKGSFAFPVRQNSQVNVTAQQDVFTNRTVSKVPINRNNNSGGGAGGGRSTTFGGSRGGSFGGGGRRF